MEEVGVLSLLTPLNKVRRMKTRSVGHFLHRGNQPGSRRPIARVSGLVQL